jgi:hypothetical protein
VAEGVDAGGGCLIEPAREEGDGHAGRCYVCRNRASTDLQSHSRHCHQDMICSSYWCMQLASFSSFPAHHGHTPC